jgi:hypothetical protein
MIIREFDTLIFKIMQHLKNRCNGFFIKNLLKNKNGFC